jgi:hypothetical protein
MNLERVWEKLESARKRIESEDVSARGLRNAVNDVLDAFEEILNQYEIERDPPPVTPWPE